MPARTTATIRLSQTAYSFTKDQMHLGSRCREVTEFNQLMERETRIELATNSLEGCDSTIELLPLSGDNSIVAQKSLK
jgi:hypothetical protein